MLQQARPPPGCSRCVCWIVAPPHVSLVAVTGWLCYMQLSALMLQHHSGQSKPLCVVCDRGCVWSRHPTCWALGAWSEPQPLLLLLLLLLRDVVPGAAAQTQVRGWASVCRGRWAHCVALYRRGAEHTPGPAAGWLLVVCSWRCMPGPWSGPSTGHPEPLAEHPPGADPPGADPDRPTPIAELAS